MSALMCREKLCLFSFFIISLSLLARTLAPNALPVGAGADMMEPEQLETRKIQGLTKSRNPEQKTIFARLHQPSPRKKLLPCLSCLIFGVPGTYD